MAETKKPDSANTQAKDSPTAGTAPAQSTESQILKDLNLNNLPFNAFQESIEYNITSPNINSNDVIDDPLIIYRSNMVANSNSSIIDINKPYYGYALEDSKAVKPTNKEAFSAISLISSLFGSSQEVQSVRIRVPFIHEKTLTNPEKSKNSKEKLIKMHTVAYLDPTIFSPTTKVAKNKLLKIQFLDQNLSKAKIIGITGQNAASVGGMFGDLAGFIGGFAGFGGGAGGGAIGANYEGKSVSCGKGGAPVAGNLAAIGFKSPSICPEQQANGDIIVNWSYNLATQAGLGQQWWMLAMAAITNAIHESALKADAVGDNGNSFGLFQGHCGGGTCATFIRKGYISTGSQLFDPNLACQLFLGQVVLKSKLVTNAILRGDVVDTCRQFTIDCERPADTIAEAERRLGTLYKHFA